MITTTNLAAISHHTVDPLHPLHAPLTLLFFGNHKSSFCVYEFGSALFLLFPCFLLFFFLIPHMSEIIWYLSFFTWHISSSIILIHSRSLLLQFTGLYFFYGSVTFHINTHTHTPHHLYLFTHQHAVSISCGNGHSSAWWWLSC